MTVDTILLLLNWLVAVLLPAMGWGLLKIIGMDKQVAIGEARLTQVEDELKKSDKQAREDRKEIIEALRQHHKALEDHNQNVMDSIKANSKRIDRLYERTADDK